MSRRLIAGVASADRIGELVKDTRVEDNSRKPGECKGQGRSIRIRGGHSDEAGEVNTQSKEVAGVRPLR